MQRQKKSEKKEPTEKKRNKRREKTDKRGLTKTKGNKGRKEGNTESRRKAALASAVASTTTSSPALPTPVVSSDILGSTISQSSSERKLFSRIQSLFALHGLQYDENNNDNNRQSIEPAVEEEIARYVTKMNGGLQE